MSTHMLHQYITIIITHPLKMSKDNAIKLTFDTYISIVLVICFTANMSVIRASSKVSIEIYPFYIKVIRETIDHLRYVNVPRKFVEWGCEHKTDIENASTPSELISPHFDYWRILKSQFNGQTYIGFAKFTEEGYRLG